MAIDEETRRTITDLYCNQHKTIRQITKITRKSSRDITAILKVQKGKSSTQANEVDDKHQGQNSIEEPLNAKAYRLFAQGKNPVEVLKELKLSETETTRYYMEYLRLVQLPDLPLTFKELGSARAVSYFAKLSNIAAAEQLTVEEVIRLLKIVKNNPLFCVEARIEEIKKMLLCLESELEEQKNMLFRYNEKIASAKLMLEERRKACKEVQVEFLRAYDLNQKLQKLVYEFKHNDKAYLEVQNIAEDKVETFLTYNNTMKLLEFAFVAITEGLRKDPQMEVLIEKTPPLQNFNFTVGQSPFSNIYDYYPHIAKEKVLESANKLYNELVKGLTDATIFTASWDR